MIISSIIGDDVQSLPLVSVDVQYRHKLLTIIHVFLWQASRQYHLKTQRLMTGGNLANNIALEEKNIIVI